MKLKKPTGEYLFIADDNPKAISIRSGFSYTFDKDGELTIGESKDAFDLEDMETKLQNGTATLADARSLLLLLVRALKRNPTLFDTL